MNILPSLALAVSCVATHTDTRRFDGHHFSQQVALPACAANCPDWAIDSGRSDATERQGPLRCKGFHPVKRLTYVQVSRFTVLVVDDEAPIRAKITAILTPMGLRVLLAEDGFKALDLLKEAVDLSIVDTQMPGMHGFDLVRALRIRWGSSSPLKRGDRCRCG